MGTDAQRVAVAQKMGEIIERALVHPIKALDAADEIIAAYEAAAWRPIGTAPRDGTTVMLYRRLDPWDVVGFGYWADIAGIAGWIAFGMTDPPGSLGLGAPTHWRPRPAPPKDPTS